MTASNETVVLKFGSSVLSSPEALPDVVSEIYRWYREGHRVIAVVSAIGNVTDTLLSQARTFGKRPCPRSSAILLGTGELASAAMLGLALDQTGVPANVLDHRQIQLRTCGSVTNATPAGVDIDAIQRALADAPVLVVPGFLGVDAEGHTTLLGRGGSDLTAIYLAQQINASRCRLIKDVDGLYESDPNQRGHLRPRRFAHITFEDALQLDGRILQRKATQFAQQVQRPFEVGALHEDRATTVGATTTRCDSKDNKPRPLRVALLGLGTVGRGVYDRLTARPDLFEITSVAVRSLDQNGGREGVPPHLVTTDCWLAIRTSPDVVIELIGGIEPAVELIGASLSRGIHVITANKAVLARHGRMLQNIAEAHGATLRGSASVGGSAPMIEQVTRIARRERITSIEGIVNGSTNVILDDLARGMSLDDAITRAQQAGFCEQDPSRDLAGIDAADKLAILAQIAFDQPCDPDDIARAAIDAEVAEDARRCGQVGRCVRHVALARPTTQSTTARVQPIICGSGHPLAQVRGERNALAIETEQGGHYVVRGRGAGRVPTTESILADLLALRRTLRTANQPAATATI